MSSKGEHMNEQFPTPVTNRLFVYGIFLGQDMRSSYGMSNPQYATVKGYITVGHRIVTAVPVQEQSACLTGLTVDIDPRMWERTDQLESGYDRKLVQTTSNEQVYMYVQPERNRYGR